MSIQAQVSLRSRKLGVLIRDARLAARKTISECAKIIGVTVAAPSTPAGTCIPTGSR